MSISFSRESSGLRNQTQVSCIAGGLLHRRQILSCLSHYGSPNLSWFKGKIKMGVVQASTTSAITLPGQEISLQYLWAMFTDPPWWRLLIIRNVFLGLGQFSLSENVILLCSSCPLFAFLHTSHFHCLDTCPEFFPRAHCCVEFAAVEGSEFASLGALKCQYLKWCPWQGMVLVMVLKHGETVLWLRQYHFVYLSIAQKRSDSIQAEFQH